MGFLSNIEDRVMILKDSVKSRIYNNPLIKDDSLANALIRHLNLRNVERVINGKSNTLTIVTDRIIIRAPLDRSSKTRCRINKIMLKKLQHTGISEYTPYFLTEGIFKGFQYYVEERLPGMAIDLRISRMDRLVVKAVYFIIKFHQETAKEIIMDEADFNRLIGRDFERLSIYLNSEYKEKLKIIESSIKKHLLNKSLKTVWMHGDYKIENILFDTKTWEIKGVIDWDLSMKEGIPLLDILYLLAYKEKTLNNTDVIDVFKKRFLSQSFFKLEEMVIDQYCTYLGISKEYKIPLLVIFWLNHVARRYYQWLSEDWMNTYTYSTINIISRYLGQ